MDREGGKEGQTRGRRARQVVESTQVLQRTEAEKGKQCEKELDRTYRQVDRSEAGGRQNVVDTKRGKSYHLGCQNILGYIPISQKIYSKNHTIFFQYILICFFWAQINH